MLRKMFIAMMLALVGLFAASGVASADPVVVTSYQAGVTVTLSGDNVAIDDVPMTLSGTGFAPNETVTLSLAGGGTLAVVQADAAGKFSAEVTLTNPGVNVITATGMTSGRTASFTVTVSAEGTTTSPGTTTVEVTTGTASTTDTAAAGAGSGSGSGGGLASTGANIAGPLTLGVSALLAGLALLFFGTRLVIRRKHGPSAH